MIAADGITVSGIQYGKHIRIPNSSCPTDAGLFHAISALFFFEKSSQVTLSDFDEIPSKYRHENMPRVQVIWKLHSSNNVPHTPLRSTLFFVILRFFKIIIILEKTTKLKIETICNLYPCVPNLPPKAVYLTLIYS